MLLRRLARPMLASIFISGGIAALKAPQGHVPVAKPVLDAVSPAVDRAVEVAPIDERPDDEMLVRIDAAVKVVAGTMLALNKFPRLASTALAASLIPTTLAAHRFWEITDAAERQAQQIHFFKNVGLLGGLMIAAADTEGKPSLAWRGRRAARLAAASASAQADALTTAAADLGGRATGGARQASGTASGLAAGLAGLAPGAAISSRTSALAARGAQLQEELSQRAAQATAKAEKRGAKLQRDAAKRSAKLRKRAAKQGTAWQKSAAKKRAELERKAPGYVDQLSAQAARFGHDVAERSAVVGHEVAKQARGATDDARKRVAALSR